MFRKRMEELQEGERGNIDWAAMPPCSTLTHIPICNTSRSSLGPVSPPEEAGGEEELVRSTSMCVTGIFHPKISTQIYHFKQDDSGEDSPNQASGSLDPFSFQMCRELVLSSKVWLRVQTLPAKFCGRNIVWIMSRGLQRWDMWPWSPSEGWIQ